MMSRLTIRRPDDWHLHLRDGAMLAAVAPDTARHFGRAMIMPNLVPPVIDVVAASAYRDRIMAATAGFDFTPYMTLYLTEHTSVEMIEAAAADDTVLAVKLYPAGATTNSASGVRDMDKVMPQLEAMAKLGLPLAVHGEVTNDEIDIFDREKRFIDTVLDPLRQRLPDLRVVMEHITTIDAVEYIRGSDRNLGATITPHHLMITRNHILAGGIRPHYYCLPVAKRSIHRDALIAATISGDARYFMGTDSAPHPDSGKLSPCGCAGIYSAPVAMGCLAQVFEQENSLDKLEQFVSLNGAGFYGLPDHSSTITLIRHDKPHAHLPAIDAGGETVTVFDPMQPVYWSVAE